MLEIVGQDPQASLFETAVSNTLVVLACMLIGYVAWLLFK